VRYLYAADPSPIESFQFVPLTGEDFAAMPTAWIKEL